MGVCRAGSARGLVAWIALFAACRAPEPRSPAPSVEVSGCREWRSTPRCDLADDDALTVWIATCPIGQVRATLEDTPLAPSRTTSVQGGAQLVFDAIAKTSSATGALGTLALRCGDGAPFSLALGRAARDARLDAIAKLRRSGQLTEAEAALTELERVAPGLTGLAGQRARNALAAGRGRDAIAAFEAAIREDVARDLGGAELRDRTALVHVLVTQHQPWSAIDAQLRALEPLARAWADAAADLDYARAAAALVFRDPRTLVPHARALITRAERLGLEESALDARQMMVAAMSFVGRWPEVARELDALRAALDRPWPSCKRAELWSNIGWHVLLGKNEAPALFAERPDDALRRAAELYARECTRPTLHANAELNLGWAALFAGELDAASTHLARATEVLPSPDLEGALNRAHLDAMVLLARGRSQEARAAFARLGTTALAAGALAAEWH
ncbi:hypothetical protein L6R52_28585, partial [Myxococcota bacterium]|nr:hypothetical protein [Myxococcota bacterium]